MNKWILFSVIVLVEVILILIAGWWMLELEDGIIENLDSMLEELWKNVTRPIAF